MPVLGLAALAMFAHDVEMGTNGAGVAGAGAAVASELVDFSVVLPASLLEDSKDPFGVVVALEAGANSGALGDGVNSFGIATDFALAAGVVYWVTDGMFSFAFSCGSVLEAGDG
jgi:hypothetical protein